MKWELGDDRRNGFRLFKVTRRRSILVGLALSVALMVIWWRRGPSNPTTGYRYTAYGPAAKSIVLVDGMVVGRFPDSSIAVWGADLSEVRQFEAATSYGEHSIMVVTPTGDSVRGRFTVRDGSGGVIYYADKGLVQ